MTDISYRRHQEEHSFSVVKQTVDSLAETFNKRGWNTNISNDAESILQDVSFEKLERTGLRTMRETTLVCYTFERPNFKVRVVGKYESQSSELKETTIKVVIGDHPDDTVIDFTVLPSGEIEENAVKGC